MNALIKLWRRMTNLPYAQGLKSEACADWLTAEKWYTLAGVPEALARALRGRARGAPPDEAVDLLRRAETVYATDAGAEALADALVAVAPLKGAEQGAALQLEAAAIYDRLNHSARAAKAYEAAGSWHDAADQYAEVGEIEAVERVIAQGTDRAVDAMTRDGLAERILGVARAGQADEAVAALAHAREIVADQRLVDAVEADLTALLPAPCRLAFDDRILCSAPRFSVGRQGDLAINLRSLPLVAVVLHRDGDTLAMTRDGHTEPITTRTAVDLGGGCGIVLAPVPGGWRVAAEVRGLPGQTVWLVDRFAFPDGSEVIADGRWWRRADRIVVRGDQIGGVRIK